jgi:AraC family transcriptional regulator
MEHADRLARERPRDLGSLAQAATIDSVARPVTIERARTASAQLCDVHCRLGPADRPYPERHGGWTIALVRRGTFAYHAHDARTRELRAGWLLLGRDGAEFECSHPTCAGDDCTSLHVATALVEDVRRATRLAGGAVFPVSALPPVVRVAAAIEAADRALRDDAAIDTDALAVAVVEAVLSACGGEPQAGRPPSRRDRDNVAGALDAIDARPEQPWPLADLADFVDASPFQLAHAFRAITGTTPHRYLVAARLRRAAVLLLDTRRRISDIAFDVGFGDLSNFIHTFRREVGMTPRAYRARRIR